MPKTGGTAPAGQIGSRVACWIFGGLILLVLIAVLFLFKSEPTRLHLGIIRFFMALAAGFFAFFFVGGVVLKGSVGGRIIGAGGGFALFIIMMLFVQPFDIKTSVVDVAPGLVPADTAVARTQETLTREGLYTGPITGKADSETRRAIREFQASKNLSINGFVNDSTKVSLEKTQRLPIRPAVQ